MASYNKVIMMGNLTRDPQLSYLPSQTPVVEFGLATTKKFKGNDGQMREDTCFVDCKAYGRTAETIQKYCTKGRPLMIEGRLQYDRWETPDGQKRSKHRIFVESFTFVGSRDAAGSSSNNQGQNEFDSDPADNGPAMGQPADDDIPF